MKRFVLLALLGLAFANWVAWGYVLEGSGLKVTFFDVGQGDAIFIETPQGHQILLDGGPARHLVAEKMGKTLPFWDKSLDLVILTHPDADHITGLVRVLEQYEVKNVLWTGVVADTNIFASWKSALDEEGARVVLARAGQKLVWSRDPANAFMEIFHPSASSIAGVKATNDTSIISKLVFGSHSLLFTGDITKAVEQKLVSQGINLRADVLKVPHHGSKYSSSEAFLAAVSPNTAVIQVGVKNSYGHPTKEALSRLQSTGSQIFRTDKNGLIKIDFTDEGLRVYSAL